MNITIGEFVELQNSQHILEATHSHLRDEQICIVGGNLQEKAGGFGNLETARPRDILSVSSSVSMWGNLRIRSVVGRCE